VKATKPAPKKVASDDESSEEEVKTKKPVTKVAPKKVESEDESSEEVKAKKPVTKAAPKKVESSEDSTEEVQVKKPQEKAVTKKVESDEESSEEETKQVVPKAQPKKEVEEEVEVVKPQKTQNKPTPQASTSTCTELFLRNLAWATDENSLEQFFSKYGTIYSKKVLVDKMTQKPRGLAFIEFSTREEAQAALNDADNLNLDGRLIQCTFSDEKPERTGGAPNKGGYQAQNGRPKSNYQGEKFTAFVGNLSFKATDQSVQKFFQSCGNVVEIRIAKNEEGKNKGFCHVDFDSSEALQSALKLAGQQLDGREVRVDASVPREGGQRGGFGGGRGRGGFGGGRGGRPQFNPMDRAKKTGALGVANSNAVKTFEDDDE